MNNGGNPTYTVLINLCKSGLDVVTKVKDTHNMKEGYLLSSSRCLEYPSHGTPWPDRASAPPWLRVRWLSFLNTYSPNPTNELVCLERGFYRIGHCSATRAMPVDSRNRYHAWSYSRWLDNFNACWVELGIGPGAKDITMSAECLISSVRI